MDVDDVAAITARKCARDAAHPISGVHVSKNASASVIGGDADEDDDEEDVDEDEDDARSNADDDRDSNRRPPPPL